MAMPVEDKRVDQNGMVEDGRRFLGVFYVNDGIVGSREYIWLHHSMNALVGLFHRYVLIANVAKSRTMTCQP